MGGKFGFLFVQQTARTEPSHARADLHPDTRNTKQPLYTQNNGAAIRGAALHSP